MTAQPASTTCRVRSLKLGGLGSHEKLQPHPSPNSLSKTPSPFKSASDSGAEHPFPRPRSGTANASFSLARATLGSGGRSAARLCDVCIYAYMYTYIYIYIYIYGLAVGGGRPGCCLALPRCTSNHWGRKSPQAQPRPRLGLRGVHKVTRSTSQMTRSSIVVYEYDKRTRIRHVIQHRQTEAVALPNRVLCLKCGILSCNRIGHHMI